MSIFKQKVILVADDELDLRELLQEALESRGANVLTAEDGQAALATYKDVKPDLLITDAKMPKMSGFELVEQVKKEEPLFPCIIVSGYAEGLEMKAHDLGVEALIMKPYQINHLVDFAKKILEQQHERKKRVFVRVNCRVDLETSFAEIRSFRTFTLNVSEGGLFILSSGDNFPTLGARVRFEIPKQDKSGMAVQGKGVCKWVRRESNHLGDAGFGIEFEEASTELKAFMKSVIHTKQVKDPEWI